MPSSLEKAEKRDGLTQDSKRRDNYRSVKTKKKSLEHS